MCVHEPAEQLRPQALGYHLKLSLLGFILICMKRYTVHLIRLFIIVSFTTNLGGDRAVELDPHPHTITVWIHGTKLTPTIICKNFFYRKLGLHGAKEYDEKYHKRAIANTLCSVCPEDYTLDDFYFFGWNGKLSFKERENASKEFYTALLDLVHAYNKKYHAQPKIRIITHSHGANVALHMAEIQDQERPIFIDEIIMLGAPVQERTKHLACHECFGKIYSFYSGTDLFQIIDPQGLYKDGRSKKTFSERTFDHYDNVKQARIKINKRSLMHIDFLLLSFITHLPMLCKETDRLYASIVPSQISYEKTFNIQTHNGAVHIHKTLRPSH